MFEVPSTTFDAPPPLPVPMARPAGADLADVDTPPHLSQAGPAPMDKVAVASTVCGLTAFVPIISQIIGLILGLWALVRIRRSRRSGMLRRGRGWAAAGIVGNGFVLIGWIALFGAFATLRSTFSDTATKLGPLLQSQAIHHTRVRK